MITDDPPTTVSLTGASPAVAGVSSAQRPIGYLEVLDSGSPDHEDREGICPGSQRTPSVTKTSKVPPFASQTGRIASRKSSRASTPSDCCLIVLPPEAPVTGRVTSGAPGKVPSAGNAADSSAGKVTGHDHAACGNRVNVDRADTPASGEDSDLSYCMGFAKEELKLISLDEALEEVASAMKYEQIIDQDKEEEDRYEDWEDQIIRHVDQLRRRRSDAMHIARRAKDGVSAEQVALAQTKANRDCTGPRSEAVDVDLELKTIKGLERIGVLDAVLKEKSQIARYLKRHRESQPSTEDDPLDAISSPNASTGVDALSEIDFRSVSSLSAATETSRGSRARATHGLGPHPDSKTFITETRMPKERLRRPQRKAFGIRAGLPDSSEDQKETENQEERNEQDADRQAQKVAGITKGFKKGDFVRRNIVLGAEARYYSAMTESEQARVELLMDAWTGDEEVQADFETGRRSRAADEESVTARSAVSTHLIINGYAPDGDDMARLQEIDSKLVELQSSDADVQSVVEAFKARLRREAAGAAAEEGPEPLPEASVDGREQRAAVISEDAQGFSAFLE